MAITLYKEYINLDIHSGVTKMSDTPLPVSKAFCSVSISYCADPKYTEDMPMLFSLLT